MEMKKVYACYNINNEVRLSSSSGAVFSSVAEYVFSKQGVVYGVAMSDDCYSAEFIALTDSAGMTRLRGSKYLQAKVGDIFKDVKDNLITGKYVLFTGTGCQVNGLKHFLGKEYDNLICIDIICHGVPSPKLWKKYVQYQERKNNGKLKGINFRCKDENLRDFKMNDILKNISEDSVKRLYISKDEDPYMQLFLRDYCLRPSCYECLAKKKKMSDLTIADFWGINDVAKEMNDGKGTSLVLIRTDKGFNVFGSICEKLKLKEVTYESGVKNNPAEYKSCILPEQRKTFFIDMNTMNFKELKKKYAAPIKYSLEIKLKQIIKKTINCIFKLIRPRRVIQNMDYSLCFVFDGKEKKN